MIKNDTDKVCRLRIHGDNILECEHALRLITSALEDEDDKAVFVAGPLFAPIFKIDSPKNKVIFEIQLIPGYGRWGFNLTEYLSQKGSPLREATDAVVTKIVENTEGVIFEEPVLALEFCGALPAGNNAWQRCGRALAYASAKIPYLYFAEVGGLELDSERGVKAARFPNPLVPLAYLSLGENEKSVALPIFLPSPSLSNDLQNLFKDCFGHVDSILLIKNILLNQACDEVIEKIKNKARKVISILADNRKRNDILKSEEWVSLEKQNTGKKKSDWLMQRKLSWNKKLGMSNLTKTFKGLPSVFIKNSAVSIGSKDMPLCLLSRDSRYKLGKDLAKIYKSKISKQFQNWLFDSEKPLLCVWLAGFKPRGDDSRPDRGLLPLGRMIFGKTDIDVLSILYGPAKPKAWNMVGKEKFDILSKSNGLWETIINLSDGLLIDSQTSRGLKNIGYLFKHPSVLSKVGKPLSAAKVVPAFGEHDVDSVIHMIFSKGIISGIYEGLCNPPGGDWSGIQIMDFGTGKEYRWTSLPRVSGLTTKRPDHLVQFKNGNFVLVIESKDSEKDLEDNIGKRLKEYVRQLILKPANACRAMGIKDWNIEKHTFQPNVNIISGVAFRAEFKTVNLRKILNRGNLNVVIVLDFSDDKFVKMCVGLKKDTLFLKSVLLDACTKFGNLISLEFVIV